MAERLMTKEDSERYIKNGGDIEKVPHIFLDGNMCNKYIELGGLISKVQKKFITSSMCETYLKEGGQLSQIPHKYINHKTCKIYIEQGGSLVDIPEEYIDKPLCSNYIEQGGNIKHVPRKLIGPKLMDSYKIQSIDDLEYIPEKYITEEIVNEACKYGTNIEYIPEKYITKEMCENYIEDAGDLKNVPRKYITKELVSKYIENGGTILNVPSKYVTMDMIDNTKNINKLNKYSNKEQKEIIRQILLSVPRTKLVKEEIKQKYNIDSQKINKALEKIKEIDEEDYFRIMDVFNNNEKSEEYAENNKEYAAEILKMFKSLGPIREGRFSKSQRIQFTYLLGNSDVKNDIYNIYDFLYDQANNSKESKEFMRYCRSYLGFKYRNKKSGFSDMDINEEQEFLMESGATWFNLVNKEKYFVDINGQRKRHFFLDNSNNTVEIQEEDLDIILKYLNTNKVPTRDCIVKEACARYVRGELEIFVEELTSGNYLEQTKEKVKVKTL